MKLKSFSNEIEFPNKIKVEIEDFLNEIETEFPMQKLDPGPRRSIKTEPDPLIRIDPIQRTKKIKAYLKILSIFINPGLKSIGLFVPDLVT